MINLPVALPQLHRPTLPTFASIIHRLEPKVDRNILVVSGEHKILEIKKHWAASIWPMVKLSIASLAMIAVTLVDSWFLYWVVFVIGLMVGIKANWSILAEFRDRFVITNQRIFRVSGVISTDRASIPILRILDITTKKPLLGRVFNYGHFVFESAAQVQGLSEITYVRDIDEREAILRMAIHGDEMHEMVTIEEDDGT